MSNSFKHLGKIISTSTRDNIIIRLSPNIKVEELEIGQYITIQGKEFHYICKITDVYSSEFRRGVLDQKIQYDEFSTEGGVKVGSIPLNLQGGNFGYRIDLELLKSISTQDWSVKEPQTIPPLFSPIRSTTNEDIQRLYNKSEENIYVQVGSLRGISDEDVKAEIDLDKILTLHGAIFAKTGSGKTFLGRIIAGHVINNPISSVLIFDMHSEYGYHPQGLKNYFGNNLIVMGLDDARDATGVNVVDETIELPRSDLTLSDIKLAISLTDAQERALLSMQYFLGPEWLDIILTTAKKEKYQNKNESNILDDFENEEAILSSKKGKSKSKSKEYNSLDELIEAIPESRRPNELAFMTVLNKLQFQIDTLPFLMPTVDAKKNSIKKILELLQQGKSIVINFGRYTNDDKIYALVTNLISRGLLETYQDIFRKKGNKNLIKVLIMLEEAHKYLNKDNLTTSFFGRFIREARKFNLGLFIIDQRPSQIHEEVLSQIGTLFIMQLSNEKDRRVIFEQSEEGIDQFESEIKKLNTQEAIGIGRGCDFVMSFKVLDYSMASMKNIWSNQFTSKIPSKSSTGEKLQNKPLGGF